MNKIFKKEIFYFLIFIFFFIFIYYLANVLIPFFIGIFIAYLLDPIVDYLESKRLGRGLSSTIVLMIFFLLVLVISLLMLPILLLQIESFLTDFPEVVNEFNEILHDLIEHIHKKMLLVNVPYDIKEALPNVAHILTNTLKSLINSSITILNIASILLITPIVSWYFLKDWDKIIKDISSFLSSKYKNKISVYANDINNIFDAYLRGQILVSTSLSVFYFLSFFILGLDYSLFIAIFAGFFSFIPFIGILISCLVTLILTYLQFVEVYFLFYIIIVFIIGQLLEANFLTPKLIGKKLGLHPLLVLLAIFIFGSLFGILGIIFATPLMATLGLILKRNLTK